MDHVWRGKRADDGAHVADQLLLQLVAGRVALLERDKGVNALALQQGGASACGCSVQLQRPTSLAQLQQSILCD